MKVSVKTSRGETYDVEVESEETLVLALKEKIAEQNGTAKDAQRLIFLGKLLDNAKPLREYGVKEGSAVHLVVQGKRDKEKGKEAESSEGALPRSSQSSIRRSSSVDSGYDSSSEMPSGGAGSGMSSGLGGLFSGAGAGGMGGFPFSSMLPDTPEGRREFVARIKEMAKNPEQLRNIMSMSLTMHGIPPEGHKAILDNIQSFCELSRTDPQRFDSLLSHICDKGVNTYLGMDGAPSGMGEAFPLHSQSVPNIPQRSGDASAMNSAPSPGAIMYTMPFNKDEALSKYMEQLNELESIGYTNKELNLMALVYSDGDLTKAVNLLIDWSREE